MKRIVAVLTGLILVSGCGQQSEAELFRSGLPSQEMVKLNPPEPSGQALTLGEPSTFYRDTRDATAFVNGSTVLVLGVIKWITDHRPTTLEENKAVWGPYKGDNGDGLRADNDWKLTVTRVAENNFNYALEAKGPSDPDTAWVVVISGSHTRAVDANGERIANHGKGTFLVDWDAAQTLPKHDDNIGTAEVTYARETVGGPVSITATFDDVHDRENEGQTLDAAYAYSHTPGNGGTFDFKATRAPDFQSNYPTLSIRSRWLQTGAGRSDVKVSGGTFDDLDPAPVINECWSTSFNSVYQYRSYDSRYNYGDAADCAFAEAEYSNL